MPVHVFPRVRRNSSRRRARVAYLELTSSEELLRSAIALYLYALGRMRDAMTRVAATRKSVPVEAASVESLSKLAEVSTI